MPTYVYRFLDADGTIEVQQSFSDAPLTEAIHPADGLPHPVKKVFTPVGVSFKGSGFYKTDSRSSSKSGTSSSSSSTSSDSASKDSATKDSATKETSSAGTPAAASAGASTSTSTSTSSS